MKELKVYNRYHYKINLFKKLTLMCSHVYLFKSGGGKTGLFHLYVKFESGVVFTIAEVSYMLACFNPTSIDRLNTSRTPASLLTR
jgi:hypothetical protein